MKQRGHSTSEKRALPKVCGADIELGNFVNGVHRAGGSGFEASAALLSCIEGLPQRGGALYESPAHYTADSGGNGGKHDSGYSDDTRTSASGWDPQDLGRKYLPETGGCAYIDLSHLELCIPEVVDAFDHVAAWHGALIVARRALQEANECRSAGRKITVLVNNSDGLGHSYGSHLNFTISRRTFDELFRRKLHYLQLLASFQVSSIVLTGQGKVGSENREAPVDFQISQRADYFETLSSIQTTYQRGIVNSRDEPHCGRDWDSASAPDAAARLHVIFFDNALAHGSALLRVGTMQLILTLFELGLVDPTLILDDPLEAVIAFSHDPMLKSRARLSSGRKVTAVELQSSFLELVKRHHAAGVFSGVVPRADAIIAIWEDSLNKLASGDLTALAPRLDWVMKWMLLERAFEQQPGLGWESSETKMLDHMYSSLEGGLYFAYEGAGATEQLVSAERIAHFASEPPADTRAWTRAMLLRRAGPKGVLSVDWDSITLRLRGRGGHAFHRTLSMPDPLGFTRAEMESHFVQHEDLEDLLDALESHSDDNRQSADAVTHDEETTPCSFAYGETKETTTQAARDPKETTIC